MSWWLRQSRASNPWRIIRVIRHGGPLMKKAEYYADELGDLRDYQDSDPPARIDWKRFAATRETMVREHGWMHKAR